MQPARCLSINAAFTLVEISIAVGLFAFAIVGIFALLPTGLRSAQESRMESVVTQIARTVLSDLRTGTFDKAKVAIDATPTFLEYDLSQAAPTPVYLRYQAGAAGTSGQSASGKIETQAEFDAANPAAEYLVAIQSKLVVTTPPVLAQVTVTVEAPASASASARKKYPVVTLMGDTR